jgi:hypothetical protein
MALTSTEYAILIARYLDHAYQRRGIKIYREVFAGKSIIGKNRRVDLLLVCEQTNQAYALECKYQGSQGTADEKIPYALEDLQALRMAGCLVYAGSGWSDGVLHLLQASPYAASCLPPTSLATGDSTRELDHLLAMHFGWWDVLTRGKQPFIDARAERMEFGP